MRRWLVAAVAAAVLAAGAAGLQAAPEAVTLELKGTPKAEARYATTLDMVMDLTVKNPENGAEVLSVNPRLEGRAVTIQRVIEVADNGDLTMGGQIESFNIKLDVADLHAQLAIEGPEGGPPKLIKLPALPIRTVVTKRGQVVAIKGLEGLIPPLPGPGGQKIDIGQFLTKIVSQFSEPVYPDKPVSVGETWGWKMTVDPAAMAETMGFPMPPEAKAQMAPMKFPIVVNYRLAGFETVNGVECAKIEAEAPWELNMPMGPPEKKQGTLHESGTTKVTSWFDYAAGRAVREHTEFGMQMTMTMGASTPVNMTMRMTGDTELQQ